MKTNLKNLFPCLGVTSREAWVLPALIAVLNLLPAGHVTAQTFTTLHTFSRFPDGGSPLAGLIVSDNTLYGTAFVGGGFGGGTVFRLNNDGTGFTILHDFTDNSDGRAPEIVLVLSGSTLYGTAAVGSLGGIGAVFAVNTDGSGFTVLHSFTPLLPRDFGTNSDGGEPVAGLILSGGTLYGTAVIGGAFGRGTVFKLNTDGTGFTTLHSFDNSDGANPLGGLILSGKTLYGTAFFGGSAGNGTVFAVNTDGTGFTILHSFSALDPTYYTNRDGVNPEAGLILSGNTLYGTAGGGPLGYGTVFAVNTDGSGFATLHSFPPFVYNGSCCVTNSDGAVPRGGLILSGNTLYGTAQAGGIGGSGTVFALNPDGTGFTTLHSFTATPASFPYINSDGAAPRAGLLLSGNTLYGTTVQGGSSGNGTVFSLSLPPPVARCKHVTVSADVSCRADASIDDGSFDPTGGTITLVHSPPGPYPLGDTSVTLTVIDSHGASNSCTATVTVVDATPPVISCPGNIVTDATSPAGAVISFAPAASDNCSSASVISSPPSGTTFPIGDTTVSCTAINAAGNQAACTFTVHVKGAAEQINGLIALVQNLGLQSGTANSLVVKLQGAASALERGNLQAACGNLGAFLNEVNAQTGRKLTAAQGGLLNAEAARIRVVLGCS